MMMKKMNLICYAPAIIAIALCSCGSTGGADEATAQHIPAAPDYADTAMWVSCTQPEEDSGVDVFYIPSTWEFDYTTQDGKICHYADPAIKAHRDDMRTEMDKVAEYMADGNRFYSPFYRHITLDTWATLDEDTIEARYRSVSFTDVRAAFGHFEAHSSGGRPFILAGFSQGAKSVVELMKILTPEQQGRMVAAYVLGYKVTPAYAAAAPWIKAAQGADDTGVTVCYNSVSDVKYIKPVVAAPNIMCINPVNWRTDGTPAVLDDTVTVTLDTAHNVLVLSGFDGSYLPNILGILNTGDYHGIEPWVYSECLRENIKERIRAFKRGKAKELF